ncbi:CHAT domain-containing protein, partial [Aquabacterium sp.]|uniref:CHAT domain-containing protein n=1 Tax=Aquabacterium sp. TaxID=1872578 RepID=UPI003D6D32FF
PAYAGGKAHESYEDFRLRATLYRSQGYESSLSAFGEVCGELLGFLRDSAGSASASSIYGFLMWFSSLLFELEQQADALHAVGIYFLGHEHPEFSHAAFKREWRLRQRLADNPSALTDTYLQLAVAADEVGRERRVGTLLKAAAQCAETHGVTGRAADLATRLDAYCLSMNGLTLPALLRLEKAQLLVGDFYKATPLQVFLAWVGAICSSAFRLPDEARPKLFQVTVRALMDISENKDPSTRLVEFDGMVHALDRCGHGSLGVLSMAATMHIIQETEGHDLSREDLCIVRNNFGNALLHGEWNDAARSVFEALINTTPSDWLTDTRVLFQLGHAYAGIGYAHYNIGKSMDEPNPSAHATFGAAAMAFEHAIACFQGSGHRTFHEARVWSCSGITQFRLGAIEKGHEHFAHALRFGHGQAGFDLTWETLVGFDYDTPLKYAEALSAVGLSYAAAFFAKLAVASVHHSALPDTSGPHARLFVGARTSVHRTLIGLLSGLGRFNEAEQVFDLMQSTAYEHVTRHSLSRSAVDALASLTSLERDVLQYVRSVALGASGGSAEGGNDFDAAGMAIAFAQIDSALRSSFVASVSNFDQAALARRLSTGMHADAALIRYVASDTELLVSIVHEGEYHHRIVSVSREDLNILVFEIRQQCRAHPVAPVAAIRTVAARLHDLLIGPVIDALRHLPPVLYLELDKPLNAVPFSMLFDGERYLCQSSTLVHLVRHAHASPPEWSSVARCLGGSRAAVLASDGGFALPGATLEARAVHAALASQTRFEEVAIFVGDACTAETLLNEFALPTGTLRLVHLASHATFNATDEELSTLLLADRPVSLRELRDQLVANRNPPALVVLSACGTARADVDVEGFTVMLLRNGVRSTISTLWESLDASASGFFGQAYATGIDPGSPRSVATALRTAALGLLGASERDSDWLAHPANWAPYVLTTTGFD